MKEWSGEGDDLSQGSDAWLRARRRRLGGSEIAAVLRLSPYKTRRELWEEKTGRREQPSISHLPHVRRGIDAEPVARGLLEARRGIVYTTPTLVHPLHPWAVASLDGISTHHTLEIKTMSKGKHEALRDTGEIPDYYEAQCQWGLMIAYAAGHRREACLFASYRPEDGTLYEAWVRADTDAWTGMWKAAEEFWGWVVRDETPAEDFVYGQG